MSELTIFDANFPPAPVADDAVGVSTPSFQTMIDDVTQTSGYKEAMDDIKHGRMAEYASLKDFYKEMGLLAP